MKLHEARVLVVEDQAPAMEAILAMLESLQVQRVATAPSGEEALKILGEGATDLVLCDWNMPGMSGLELAKVLRQEKIPTQLVMVTGRRDQESVLQAKDVGLEGYLAKPFTREELFRKLSAALK